jgi:hypothetical protein
MCIHTEMIGYAEDQELVRKHNLAYLEFQQSAAKVRTPSGRQSKVQVRSPILRRQ